MASQINSAMAAAVALSNPFNHHVRCVKELFFPHGLVLSFVSKSEASKLEVDLAEPVDKEERHVKQIAGQINAALASMLPPLGHLIAQYAVHLSFYSDPGPVATVYISSKKGFREVALYHTLPPSISYVVQEGRSEKVCATLTPSDTPKTQWVMPYGEFLFTPTVNGVRANAVFLVFRAARYHETMARIERQLSSTQERFREFRKLEKEQQWSCLVM